MQNSIVCQNDIPRLDSHLKQESPPEGNRKWRTTRGKTCPSVTSLGGGGGLGSPFSPGRGSTPRADPALVIGGDANSLDDPPLYPIQSWLGGTLFSHEG